MPLEYSYTQIQRDLDSGKITPMQALFEWTRYSLKTRVLNITPFFEHVRETLPHVTWHKPGEELLVPGYCPVTWTCAADFYRWADNFMGNVMSLGVYLRDYIEAESPEAGQRIVDAAVQRAREIQKDVEELGSQAAAAEKHGISQGRVSQIISPRTNKDRKRGAQVALSAGTNPATAAERIREKLGDDFANQLREAL